MPNTFKPKFGDIIENEYASYENPRRLGVFVRIERRTGRINPGKHALLTDMEGKFWESSMTKGHKLKVIGSTIKTYKGKQGSDWRYE